MTNSDEKAVVGIFDTHVAAENAVKELQKAGFDMKKLSIVGKDYHTDEHVVGYYNTGDRMKAWEKSAPSGEASGVCSLELPSSLSRA